MKKQSDNYKIDSSGRVYIEKDGEIYYYSSQGEFLKNIFNNNLETYKQSIDDVNSLSDISSTFSIREDT